MSASKLFGNNPFFRHGMDKLCAICHRELEENKSQSIFTTIPKLEPKLTAFQVLQNVSDFNIEKGPQNMCSTCFHNTTSAYKFILICNKAQETIKNYLEQKDNFTTTVENDCQGVEENREDNIILVVADSENMKRDTKPVASPSSKVEPTKVTTADADGRVKCEVCHKMYLQPYILVHMRTHTGEKPYQCEICSKAFVSVASLHLHQVSHTDDRRYICNYCGKRFKLLRTLRGHERVHTGERPYKCKFCGKSFGVSSVLKNHYLVHTKEKRFQCDICLKGFGRKIHLNQHLVTHDVLKKHQCQFCGNRFTQAQSLRSHLNTSCQAQTCPVDDVVLKVMKTNSR